MKWPAIFCQFVVLLSVCLSLAACPSKQSGNSGVQVQTVIMGDPEKLIEGAELRPEIDFDLLNTAQTIDLFQGQSFTEKKQYSLAATVNEAAVETKAAPSTGSGHRTMQFTLDRTKSMRQLAVFHSQVGTLTFARENGANRMSFVRADGHVDVAEIIHFSVSNNGRLFSVMFRDHPDATSGKAIEVFYFAKDFKIQAPTILELPEKYNYLAGPNALYRWPQSQSMSIGVCGANARKNQDNFVEATKKWNSILSSSGQKIDVKSSATYFPFSDLKQNCFYYVDSYLSEPNPKLTNYGNTYYVLDYESQDIISASIIIFGGELDKLHAYDPNTDIEIVLKFALVHELGHFIGLDHQFNPNIQSLMGYNFSVGTWPTDYDKRAVNALYKY